MNAETQSWIDEMVKQGAPKTEREKKIAEKVIEIEERVKVVVKESGVDSDRFIIETTNAAGGVTSRKLNHKEFAEWLVNESEEHFITVRGDDHVYMYESGVYIEHGESFIKSMLYNVMDGECVTRNGESEVLSHVRAMTYSDRSVFDGCDDVINMNNGLYVLSTGIFLDHTPEHKTLTKSAVNYDPDATCPTIDKFIKETATLDRVETFYEIAGYALMPQKLYKRGFMLIGVPDTGKSQYMELLSEFVGRNMTATVTPNALGSDTHAGAGLYGKLINVVDDLTDAPILDTGVIKSIIGFNAITYNQKNKPAFSFVPNVVNVWGCNTLPKTNDKHFGDKFDLLYVNNVYGGHEKPDQKLLAKITTEEELSGFFNKSVEAFRKVEERGDFTGSLSSRDRQRAWEQESRPIATFCEIKCKMVEGALVVKDGFYKAYINFCKSTGKKIESKAMVVKYLEEEYAVFEMKSRKSGEFDNPRACFLGIEILLETDMFQNQTDLFQKPTPPHSPSGGGFVPDVPGILPTIAKSLRNGEKSIVEEVMGRKVGTSGTKHAADGENNDVNSGTISGTPKQQSKPIDLDQSTIDRIRKATSDAMANTNNSDGCGVDEITKATRGLARSTVAKCVLLNPGNAWESGAREGLYMLRTELNTTETRR